MMKMKKILSVSLLMAVVGWANAAELTADESYYAKQFCQFAEQKPDFKSYLEYGFAEKYSTEADCVTKFLAVLKMTKGSEEEQHRNRDYLIGLLRRVDQYERYDNPKRFTEYFKVK